MAITEQSEIKSKSSIPLPLEFDLCSHSIVLDGFCTICHHPIPQNHDSIAFDYITKGLRLTIEEINRLKANNTLRVLSQKKLHLVLDLDQTLIQTKIIGNPTPKDELANADRINGSLFNCGNQFLLKLRPFVRRFLEEANSMFEMFICSKGTREYVKKVVKFLDPEGKYFEGRLIAREDMKHKGKKDLKLVLGEDRCTVAVDDTWSVWSDHMENLVTVRRYVYFKGHGCRRDDRADGGELIRVLAVLRKIHGDFFRGTTEGKDVRCMEKSREATLDKENFLSDLEFNSLIGRCEEREFTIGYFFLYVLLISGFKSLRLRSSPN